VNGIACRNLYAKAMSANVSSPNTALATQKRVIQRRARNCAGSAPFGCRIPLWRLLERSLGRLLARIVEFTIVTVQQQCQEQGHQRQSAMD
jgi:hypothetical protein